MSSLTNGIRNLFRFHKMKMGLFVLFFIAFFVMLFPYNDLGDLVTAKVSQYTQNSVYLQFSDLNPSLFPTLGLEFENVSVDTPVLQSIKANRLTIHPSILSLLAFKPGLNIGADGLFRGSADISGSLPGMSPEASTKPHISGEITNMELTDIVKALKLPIDISGRVSAETDSLSLNLENIQQVNGDFSAQIKNAKLDATNINTPLGPLPLPSMSFSTVDLKANAKNGTVRVEKLALGKTGDELSGSARGQF